MVKYSKGGDAVKSSNKQIPRHIPLLLAAQEYFQENNELIFLTPAGSIVGKISSDENLHFSKIKALSKKVIDNPTINGPEFQPTTDGYAVIIKNARFYPNGVMLDQEPLVTFPELALFADQIVAVSATEK